MDLLRLITCGNVDDGKSTLIGRLLYDTKSIFEDQWDAVERASVQRGDPAANLALLTDGLRAEREQGITIDVAYRYFATPRRKFIMADCPGHFEFTRNMVTGASSAQLAMLLIDVRHGVMPQTCRHAFITTLLRIKHLIVLVNKMDLVNFEEAAFERVRQQFMDYAERLDAADIQFIPISALHGDNVVEKSTRIPWYHGTPLLYTLESVYVRNDANYVDARFPIQTVLAGPVEVPPSTAHRPLSTVPPPTAHRLYAGQVASGIFRAGDEVVDAVSGQATKVRAIHGPSGPITEAYPPMSVALELDPPLPLGRGAMLARAHNRPTIAREFEVMLCWLSEQPYQPSHGYRLRHTSLDTACELRSVLYKVDINTLHRFEDQAPLAMNDLARVTLRTTDPVAFDSYKKNRQTGGILLVDAATNTTVATGMIL
ncbi:MAG TPA: GTP-binding protein [Opitutaceae bacterium]|nr:GTP-binding protein [Opitutaceae bacterium]